MHFKKYLEHYKPLLARTFENYEEGFINDLLELYAQTPFLLKFSLMLIINGSVFKQQVVVSVLLRRLFSGEAELQAVLIEVVDEITCMLSAENRLGEMADLKNAFYGEVLKSGEKSLLHQKTVQFVFDT